MLVSVNETGVERWSREDTDGETEWEIGMKSIKKLPFTKILIYRKKF